MLSNNLLAAAVVGLFAVSPLAMADAPSCGCQNTDNATPAAPVVAKKVAKRPVAPKAKARHRAKPRASQKKPARAAAQTATAATAASFAPVRLGAYACELDQLAAGQEAFSKANYTVRCLAASQSAPAIYLSGDLATATGAPLLTTAHYAVKQPDMSTMSPISGSIRMAAKSVAELPADIGSHLLWDPVSATLSVERAPGIWQIWQGQPLHAAGYASTPVQLSRATTYLDLDASLSRFSGKMAPRIVASMELRDGLLRVDPLVTTQRNQATLVAAIEALDRNPQDMARAWAVGSAAQFLAQPEIVTLATQKVAAHHPHHLREFQMDLAKIQDFEALIHE